MARHKPKRSVKYGEATDDTIDTAFMDWTYSLTDFSGRTIALTNYIGHIAAFWKDAANKNLYKIKEKTKIAKAAKKAFFYMNVLSKQGAPDMNKFSAIFNEIASL